MALDKTNLIALAKVASSKSTSSAPATYSFGDKTFSYEEINDTLRSEMNELCGSYKAYRENKNMVFSIIEEVIDDVLPKKVKNIYPDFAEIKVVGQGDKPLFRRKISARQRAKQFVTRVGLAGRYEVWKLNGTESFEVPTSAIGGAIQIGFEEFLDGRVDWAEMLDILLEGIEDLIAHEIQLSLIGALGQLPAANQYASAGFNEGVFDQLVSIISAYGDPVIYCFDQFATRMIPQEAWRYSDNMKDQIWNTGRLQLYKGHKVVILENSMEDETNASLAFDPSYAWIIPGGDTKPVKVVVEGDTCILERENDDWSRDLHMYKKVGVVAMLANNIGCYRDTSLSKTAWTVGSGPSQFTVITDNQES